MYKIENQLENAVEISIVQALWDQLQLVVVVVIIELAGKCFALIEPAHFQLSTFHPDFGPPDNQIKRLQQRNIYTPSSPVQDSRKILFYCHHKSMKVRF